MKRYYRTFTAGLLASGLAISVPAYAQDASDAESDIGPDAEAGAEREEEISVDEVQAEIASAFEVVSEYGAEDRDQALKTVRDSMDRIDEEIELLEARARARWADMAEPARQTTAEMLSTLRDRQLQLSEMYGAMSEGSDSAWDDLVSGVSDAWQGVEEAWDDAMTDANANAE